MESERMTRVMGIVNVTPDSFSDGGKYFRPEEAVRRALNLIDEGADIIDIGAESTRPGSVPISWEEEWSRLEPVLKGLSPRSAPVQADANGRENSLQKENLTNNKHAKRRTIFSRATYYIYWARKKWKNRGSV